MSYKDNKQEVETVKERIYNRCLTELLEQPAV